MKVKGEKERGVGAPFIADQGARVAVGPPDPRGVNGRARPLTPTSREESESGRATWHRCPGPASSQTVEGPRRPNGATVGPRTGGAKISGGATIGIRTGGARTSGDATLGICTGCTGIPSGVTA